MSDADVVAQAKSLGFNVLEAQSPGIVRECHRQGIKAAGLIYFGSAPEGCAQVISPTEEATLRREEAALPPAYQYGGEPVRHGEVMIEGGLWCFDRPEALEFGKKEIDRVIAAGYDVIALDYIGYQNYHACFCPISTSRHEEYLKTHPGISRKAATDECSRDSLVSFYNALVAYAKSKKPQIVVTAHLYPCFIPDPIYGNRTSLDYCGQTVSWFFQPHWNLGRVRRYAHEVVARAGRYNPSCTGAPFIGIYTLKPYENDRKTPERVRDEIRIVKESGAKAIQFAELGNILNDPEIARVVREELNPPIGGH
jgi:hypothetical protein